VRLLLVDDDPGLRALVRTTFEVVDVDLSEAEDVVEAASALRTHHPDVIVLDVGMPGIDGLAFCRELKDDPGTREVPVVLLTGADDATPEAAAAAGADALVRKPFSPLELLALVERLAAGIHTPPPRVAHSADDEQLLLYARDLRQLLEIERGQRLLLQKAYRQTVSALASALESKDFGTRAHSQRVQRYAIELARYVAPDLAADESAEYGFLLHDVGKIGIPDRILQKPAPLTDGELRLMKTHTVLGEQMLTSVAFLAGEGVKIVRHHHERWDGGGYPDGLDRTDIPAGARVFALADSLDAMTSDRPYRKAVAWEDARAEILGESGRQFDPDVVDAFQDCEPALREIQHAFAVA
jgi:response regulator RpfG family c-di-GMP phosphodiesterase